jgi:(4S)-4-hydroxy-5-phosphonooxypentane-2,3-dione isomerase
MVRWIAKPGQEEEIARILRKLEEKSRLEPGCTRFDVYRSEDDAAHFLLHEVYGDQAALENHQHSEHFRLHVLSEASPLLQNRERTYYRPL